MTLLTSLSMLLQFQYANQDALKRLLEMSVLPFIQLIAAGVIQLLLQQQGHQIATALD
jgi:hypothetical protein